MGTCLEAVRGVSGGPRRCLSVTLPGPVPAAGHEVRADLRRQARGGVSEVRSEDLDALAGVQEDGRVQVPRAVHAVFAGGGVLSASFSDP